jgi:2,3-bisphosphoglycerate-dependent phosphoglycerate mutase
VQSWPESLWVVRHGESAGNVARDLAEAEGHELIDIAERDVDVPLSDLGRQQSEALGHWIAERPQQPTVVWTSPYVRARQTAEIALQAAGLEVPVVVDERLREREFGILDRLTRRGIEARYPEESERRARLGKFYHRPPGGESWSDVLLRLRAVLDEVRRDCEGERVLLVCHQVVVLLVRYVVEGLDEQGVLAIGSAADVANCSVTSYRRVETGMELQCFNEVAPLLEDAAPVTAEPDLPAGAR